MNQLENKLKFIDFFAGIGGFRSGLEKAGMKCAGYCEFDKHARKSYQAMYKTEGEWTAEDVRTVKGKDLPNADIWTLGFPCQDISIAGRQKGIKEGTRSGLFYEIIRLLKELKEYEKNKPRYIIIENVKNLLSIDKGWGFYNVLTALERSGYDVEWQLYNSKNYGVPQNRERVYIIGHLRDGSGGEIQHRRGQGKNACLPKPQRSINKIENIGSMNYWSYQAANKIISEEGVAPTILTRGDESRVVKVLIKNATKKGYIEAEIGDGIDFSFVKSTTRRGRVQKNISQTLTTKPSIGVLKKEKPLTIRRLTPKECWRLQGFTDEQYEKAARVVSEAQLYKQAGNAVTVNVVEAIGKSIVKHHEGVNNRC